MEKDLIDENFEPVVLGSYNEFSDTNKQKEKVLLESVCKQYDIDVETVSRLISLEMSMIGKLKRRGLQNQIDTIIQSAIMSKKEEV